MEKEEKKGLIVYIVYWIIGLSILWYTPHVTTHILGKDCYHEKCLEKQPNTLVAPIVKP